MTPQRRLHHEPEDTRPAPRPAVVVRRHLCLRYPRRSIQQPRGRHRPALRGGPAMLRIWSRTSSCKRGATCPGCGTTTASGPGSPGSPATRGSWFRRRRRHPADVAECWARWQLLSCPWHAPMLPSRRPRPFSFDLRLGPWAARGHCPFGDHSPRRPRTRPTGDPLKQSASTPGATFPAIESAATEPAAQNRIGPRAPPHGLSSASAAS